MTKQYEIERFNNQTQKWALYAVESTLPHAKKRAVDLLKTGVPECDIRTCYVTRENIDFLTGCADNVIREYFNFCAKNETCEQCEYCDEENSVACLKRFIAEWEDKEKEKLI